MGSLTHRAFLSTVSLCNQFTEIKYTFNISNIHCEQILKIQVIFSHWEVVDRGSETHLRVTENKLLIVYSTKG